MQEATCILRSNERIAKNTYESCWTVPVDVALARPGQFVNLRLEGRFLRRPLSVCDADSGTLTLIYKVVGAGTEQLAAMPIGTPVSMLMGLGNGYDLSVDLRKPLLIGGGTGVAPMYLLARRFLERGTPVQVVMGFSSADEIYYADELAKIGATVHCATVDGSVGVKGFVTDALPASDTFDYTYACGPEPMLKALYHAVDKPGQFSFEARMGCGFGACMGCSCQTIAGPKRICKEGPVLSKEMILW